MVKRYSVEAYFRFIHDLLKFWNSAKVSVLILSDIPIFKKILRNQYLTIHIQTNIGSKFIFHMYMIDHRMHTVF